MKQTVEHLFFTSPDGLIPMGAPSKECTVLRTTVTASFNKDSGYTHLVFKHFLDDPVAPGYKTSTLDEPTFDNLKPPPSSSNRGNMFS